MQLVHLHADIVKVTINVHVNMCLVSLVTLLLLIYGLALILGSRRLLWRSVYIKIKLIEFRSSPRPVPARYYRCVQHQQCQQQAPTHV